MARIKAGIVGAGFISGAHVDALRRLGYVDIVALAGDGDGEARARSSEWGIARAYGEYRDLLADKDVQVVHNCTPNWLHFEVSRAALEAGKHVLSEKPLAVNSQQSTALVRLARDLPLVAAVDFNHRSYPQIRQAKRMVQTGRLGRVQLCYGGYYQDWMLLATDYNWRVDPELGGASRAIADIGSHWYDLLRFVTGLRATEVFAELRVVHPRRQRPASSNGPRTFSQADEGGLTEGVEVRTEDAASVALRLTDGAFASFVVSQVSAGRKNRLFLEITGEKSALSWDGEDPERIWIGYRGQPNQILMRDPGLMDPEARAAMRLPGGHPEGWYDALYRGIKDIYDFIDAGGDQRVDKPPFATFEDGHEAILMVEAALRSNSDGRWVKLPREQ